MKAIGSSQTKGINFHTYATCADNSGAKIVSIIAVKGFKPRKREQPSAGIADMVKVVVKKGKPEVRKKVFWAVVVRTRKEYRRPNGMRVKFEDNAVVIVDEDGIPKGSEIKGPIAREAAERWPKLAGVASQIV